MKNPKYILKWIANQFRTHTVRSILITVPGAALVTAGILWACGVFEAKETFAYLPDREYILAPSESREPQTLEELLHVTVSEPELDTILRNPAIMEELLKAEKLTDVVDSRIALYNLQSLDRQLSERIEQLQQANIATDSAAISVEPSGTSGGLTGTSVEPSGAGDGRTVASVEPSGTSGGMTGTGEEYAGTIGETAGKSTGSAGPGSRTADAGTETAGMVGAVTGVSGAPADSDVAPVDNSGITAGAVTDTAGTAAAASGGIGSGLPGQPEQLLSPMSAKMPGSQAGLPDTSANPSDISVSMSGASSLPGGIAVGSTSEFAVSDQTLLYHKELLNKAKEKTRELLKRKEYGDPELMPSTINLKGIWQSPGEALIHLTPSGDWLPEQGYRLYREVNGQKFLIGENAASPAAGLSGGLKVSDADVIQELYKQARLTPEKLGTLGMTAKEFREKAYLVDSLEPKERISGKIDFQVMKEALITVPSDIGQKIPLTDRMHGSVIYIQDNSLSYKSNLTELKFNLWNKFSLVQAQPPNGISTFGSMLDGALKMKLVKEIMSARQQISTLAFVDDEFAEEAGFLIRDDLTALSLSNGTKIEYIAEAPDGSKSSVTVTHGEEKNLTKPQGLMAYGIDGKVAMRWDESQDEEERSIVSGYHIERRLDGEAEFARITDKPITASYVLDEHDKYFQSPVFFEDEVKDGRTAEYRIYSIDVFGRRSEYSDTVSVAVVRVTPPNAPNIESPALSGIDLSVAQQLQAQDSSSYTAAQSGAVRTQESVIQNVIQLNSNKPGIVLPIFTDTPDTVRFTIYRAKAVGAGNFGPPEILADIAYDNPRPPKPEPISFTDELDINPAGYPKNLSASESPKMQFNDIYKKKSKKGIHVVMAEYSPVHPDMVYFDTNIEKGCTYKYWVSAWDKWNNESAWSQSVTMGVPTEKEPEIPQEIDITMHVRRLPDRSIAPPGLVSNGPVPYADIPEAPQAGTPDNVEWTLAGLDFPERSYPAGAIVGTIESAAADRAQIGSFLSFGSVPKIIDAEYGNMPDRRYIHKFVGVMGEDLLPGGTTVLRWPAYSGDGLGGYAVYRPLFTPKSLEEMQQMSYSELVDMGKWQLITDKPITHNQIMLSGLDETPGKLSLFLVCLEPEKREQGLSEAVLDISLSSELPEGGYVILNWDKPDDPQVQHYRVYRSEVPTFDEPIDETQLEWTLVGDRIEQPRFTQKVDQSFAHYYYYKVTSVSPWGMESATGKVQRFRVPSTKPPETPNLLVPLSTKEGVKINFSAVQHCSRYEIWRTPIPVLSKEEIDRLAREHTKLYEALFGSPDGDVEDFINDYFDSLWGEHGSGQGEPQPQPAPMQSAYEPDQYKPAQSASVPSQPAPMQLVSGYSGSVSTQSVPGPAARPQSTQMPLLSGVFSQDQLKPVAAGTGATATASATSQLMTLNPVSKLNTISNFNVDMVNKRLGTLPAAARLTAFNAILEKYGPLALADYSQLSWEMSRRVKWEKIGELPAKYDTKEAVDPATGLLKPLSYTDTTAQYGVYYLYTVQAWNDDNLGSTRPEPVTATPRRNRPFDPIDGLTGEIVGGIPKLKWNTPKMPNVLPEKCLEDTVGYIVYRSDTRDGTYYQASPLLFENRWADTEADKNAFNWYRVKVLDTGGYLSEFSEPILLQEPFIANLVTIVPDFDIDLLDIAQKPQISFGGSSYTTDEGTSFEIPYTLSGTEPITVTMKAVDNKGAAAAGFTLNSALRKVTALPGLKTGTYSVMVTAKNSAGESSASFTLTVKPREVEVKDIPQLPVAITPTIRFGIGSHTVYEGTEYDVSYNLSGTEPITVTIKATDENGREVSGFTLNTVSRRITASSKLSAGTYKVTVTAKNSAGESSDSFTLSVKPKIIIKPDIPEIIEKPKIPDLSVAIAPRISFGSSRYSVTEGAAFETIYSITGTEPITVTLKAVNSTGKEVGAFSVDTASRKVTAPSKLLPDTYSVTVTAKNSAGESSASFTLTVQAIPKGEPPMLLDRDDGYNLKMYISPLGTADYTAQFRASGTEPLTWSLGPYKGAEVPAEVTIDNNGLLTVKRSIKKGTHRFFLKVSNAFGSDTKAVLLEVTTLLRPSGSIPPDAPVMLYASAAPDALAVMNASTDIASQGSAATLAIQSGTNTTPVQSAAGTNNGPVAAAADLNGPVITTADPIHTALVSPSGTNTTPVQSATDPAGVVASPHTFPAMEQYDFISNNVRCMGFTLTDVKLTDSVVAYYGTAMLKLGGTSVPVQIIWGKIAKQGGADTLTEGTVFITQPVQLPDIGLTLASLDIQPKKNYTSVSGYLKSKLTGSNLAGDLYSLSFEGAKLYPGAIEISKDIPDIRYRQLKIYNTEKIMIDLNAAQNQGKGLLMLQNADVSMKFHLETLRNDELIFENTYSLNFDSQGRLNGTIETKTEQFLQLLVPGGAGLRVREAMLNIADGEFKSNGKLRGKLVIPFEKSTAKGDLVPAVYAGAHPAHSPLDDLVSGGSDLSEEEQDALNGSLVHFGSRVQQNSLLILPKSFEQQDKCASAPINLNNWNGEGFVISSSTLDNVRVTNRNLSDIERIGDIVTGDYIQRQQALIISGTNDSLNYITVSVDLSRTDSIPKSDDAQGQSGTEEILTPKETEKPFWVGIVFGKGKLALPSKYLQQADGGTIRFDMAKGEMIYDLNGFNYQTYLYGSDPEGVPARFGDNLGGFKDVRIKDCLLDLYANSVNIEINATVIVDLLQRKKVEAKLYTDDRGEFVCSVAPTSVALANGIDMRIDGGFFEKRGMRIYGQLTLPSEGFDAVTKEPLAFTDLTIPSSLNDALLGQAAQRTAGVVLDRPVKIDFKGFPMEVREFDLKYKKKDTTIPSNDNLLQDAIRLTLRGATQLSDNIALSREATDSLAIRFELVKPNAPQNEIPEPTLLYTESKSELNTSFDGCIDVMAKKLVPKVLPAGSQTGGLVEFETDGLDLNFLGQSLKSLPVNTKTRFGKQPDGKFYYAVGLTPLNGQPINFGAGDIDKFTGLVAYNMIIGTDEQGRYNFPVNPGQMQAYINGLQVGGGKFVGGIKGEMSVSGLCTIKNLYFCFEPGPSVTAEGDLYVPLSIESISTGKPDKFMGKAAISYRHPERYLSFTMTLDRINLILAEVGGSLGFEYSPSLFGVYLGYPETLAGNIGIFHVGAGVGFRYDWEKDAGMVQAKMEFGLEKSMNIAIVYIRGYLYAGADGMYYWTPEGSSIRLTLYLRGGIEGGVKVAGKRFKVIGFYLDAQGTLASRYPGYDKWDLACTASISYCVDVFLYECEGSVTADFATTIG